MSTIQYSNADDKQCRQCNQWKPRSEFYKAKGYRDGLHSYCKVCQREASYQSRQQEDVKARERIYRQTIYYDRQLELNRQSQARPEAKAKRREYLQQHPEYSRITSLNYLARKKQAQGSFSLDEWRRLCEKYDHRCLWCGERKKLEPDHVIPLALGGSNTIDNIQPLCRKCNGRKSDRHMDFR